jgi:hypothetical protein
MLLQVPADLSTGCRTYGELFQQLLCHQGMLGLGLYRRAEYCEAVLPYVHTNPAKVGGTPAGGIYRHCLAWNRVLESQMILQEIEEACTNSFCSLSCRLMANV